MRSGEVQGIFLLLHVSRSDVRTVALARPLPYAGAHGDDSGPGTGRPPARAADRARRRAAHRRRAAGHRARRRDARRERGRRRRGRAARASAARPGCSRATPRRARRATPASAPCARRWCWRRWSSAAGPPPGGRSAASGWPARPRSGRIFAAAWRRCRSRSSGRSALDVRHRVQSETCLARGSLTGVEIHPRDVFRPLIRQATAAVIFCHNHPSGDPAPSRADVELTGAPARGRRSRAASPCSITSSSGGKASSASPSGIGDSGSHRIRRLTNPRRASGSSRSLRSLACRSRRDRSASTARALGDRRLPGHARARHGRTRRGPTRSATRARC